jgi:hypothetical protein
MVGKAEILGKPHLPPWSVYGWLPLEDVPPYALLYHLDDADVPFVTKAAIRQELTWRLHALRTWAERSETGAPAWGPDEAYGLVASCLPAWDAPDRSHQLGEAADAIDRAWLAHDLAGLREAVAAFHAVADRREKERRAGVA